MVPSSRLLTHASRPSGVTSIPSAPAPVGIVVTEPAARSITVTEPEPMLAT